MARLSRFTQLIFGSNAGASQMAEFGSLAASAPQTYSGSTITPAIVQTLSNYLTGWFGAVIGANSPAEEDMNSLFYLLTYQMAYIMSLGVPEWDSATTYYIGAITSDGTGKLYVSLTNTNLNNALSSTTNWKLVGGNVMTTLGDTTYGGATPAGVMTRLPGNTSASKAVLTQTGTGSASASPVWSIVKAPTIQSFTATGTQTGWLFTISTSSTVAVGDTYTNNGNTYTVQGALSAQSGQVLFMSGTGATSGTTLTRATGSGTASITFSATLATATYTAPTSPAPLYIRVRAVGGGGGGGGGGNAGGADGVAGVGSFFGANIVRALSGGGSIGQVGGVGGSSSFGAASGIAVAGGDGQGAFVAAVTGSDGMGGQGGGSGLGGNGGGGLIGTSGTAGKANTGGGGGGGGCAPNAYSGPGGGSGGFSDCIIANPLTTYVYEVGTGGSGGAGSAGGGSGAAGGTGLVEVTEFYQ